MARPAKIWLRESDGFYYATLRGAKVKLARDKAEAERAFHEAKAREPEPEAGSRPSFRLLADLFLSHAAETKAPATYDSQRYFLQSFCDSVKARKAADLRVADVTAWILNAGGKRAKAIRGRPLPADPSPRWGHNSQVTARAVVRACLNWAVDQGYLSNSPLGRLKAGGYHRRERVLTPDEKRRIRAAVRDAMFGDFFDLVCETGMRPFSEAARITPAMVDPAAGTVTFAKHKNARKGKTRVVYLTPRAAAILARRAEGKPADGLLFHTRNGRPFSGPNTVQRVRRLEARTGVPRFSLYAARHAYITEALERGLSSDLVGELCGNTPKTIAKFYSHLDSKKDTLRAAALKAVS